MHYLIDHPIVRVKLSKMRNEKTDSRDFRSNLSELSQFMAYEVTKSYETEPFPIKTPLAPTNGYKLKSKICLLPILRAGLGMVDGFKNMIPSANIGHLGLYRNEETLKPVEYYFKVPQDISESNVIILDPMCATGFSTDAAIQTVLKMKPKSIKVVNIVSSKEGLALLEKKYPDIEFYTAAIDEKLNGKGYIVPGLGDAGDRLFGTK